MLVFLAMLLWGALPSAKAQEPASEDELIELADQLFNENKFGEAMQRYSQLLSLYPTDAFYNYRYGATLVYAEADKEKAFKHLRFAVGKNDIPEEVHYFLGKAYHLNYQFADALEEYQLYKQRTVDQRRPKWDVTLAIRQCTNGLKLLSKIKDVKVLKKVETSAEDFFRNYDLSDIGGRVLVCPEELLSKYDLKSGERFLMYFPGNTTNAFFSSYGKSGETGRDIYRAVRLPNGNWSRPIPMTKINTPYNDDFPFLHPDGKTFYFSSEGHSSMGGYDVFKCDYSDVDDSFTQPENLDFAVNSPDDDLLYITDKQHDLAYFASSRSSDYDRIHVYRVRVSAQSINLVLLKGQFIPEVDGVTKSARITVVDATSNALVGEYVTEPSTGKYVIDLPHSGRFKFTIDADGSKLAHNGIVDVPASGEVVAYAQEIRLIETNNIEKLIIKNSFDKPLNTDLYALAQGILKYRADLAVNDDGTVSEQPPVTAGDDMASAYVDAGFAASLSNEAVFEEAKAKEERLTQKSEELRGQRDYAFTMAQKKRQNAAEAARDAEDYLRLADAVGEEAVSRKYLIQAMASRFAAEKLSEESRVALRLSQQLSERLAEVEQAEQQAGVLAEDVEGAIRSGSYDDMVAAMKALKQQETAEREAPEDQADEYLLLRKKAQERRKSADVESRMAQDLREEESNLTLRIKNKKLQLESAKNKDKPDIQKEIDVLEADLTDVQEQIERIYGGMESTQQEAEWMAAQAELFRQISEEQSDTYIPEDQVQPYDADQASTMVDQIVAVEEEAAGMEFNLNVVRDILEEESNVAVGAFENEAEFQAFVEQYDLPKRARDEVRDVEEVESGQPVAEALPRDREAVEEDIKAARDWMDVIDESIAGLEAERETLTAGARRDSIDRKLEEFQNLKYQKAQEVERARETLTAIEEREMEPYTIAKEPEDVAPSSEQRETLTIVQSDPIYNRIDPGYNAALAAIAAEQLPVEEEMERKNELDRAFVGRLDSAIVLLENRPAGSITDRESRDLEVMQLLRNQMSEELAFRENQIAEANGSGESKTSTEILMEARGLTGTDDTENVVESVEREESSAEAIPESISYDDIDPNYEAAMASVAQTFDDPAEQRAAENRLHRSLIEGIEEEIATYSALAETAEGDDLLRIERAIGQLQQVKNVKADEIEKNDSEIAEIRRGQFADEYDVVVEEIDSEYVAKYWAIEESADEPYLKAVAKAQLEQSIVEKIDAKVETLVEEMDAATAMADKQQIQETIQELQLVRQEKVIAYESLYAQAEQLQVEETAVATSTDVESSPQSTAQTQLNEAGAEGLSVQSEAEDGLTGVISDVVNESGDPTVAEMEAEALTEAIDNFVNKQEDFLANLDEYTVFGAVNDVRYKSLNASLEMETIGGDLRRHQNRVSQFVRENAGGQLDAEQRASARRLLRDEMVMQERIAEASALELEYYASENQSLLTQISANPPAELPESALNQALADQAQGEELQLQAATLREQALGATTVADRLTLEKAAFEREMEAVEVWSRVNRALTTWEKGIPTAYDDTTLDVEPIVRRSEPLADVLANAQTDLSQSQTDAQTADVEMAEATERVNVGELMAVDSDTFSEELRTHFALSDVDIEAVRENDVYTAWFKSQWAADSLERVRVKTFTRAEVLLDDAEAKLLASERAAAEAEAEADPEAQKAGYDRAAALQEEAKALFEEAGRLREQMAQYDREAENARQEASELLAGLNEDEAQQLSRMAEAAEETTALADRDVDTPGAPTAEETPIETSNNLREPAEQPEQNEQASTAPTSADAGQEYAEQNTPVQQDIAETIPEQEAIDSETSPPVEEETESTAVTSPEDFGDIDFSAGVGEVFETLSASPYSAENPIPIGVEWPEGLVFAVQVGAFRNPIPQDLFSGFTPVRGERLANGITRYSAGLFNAFNRANAAKNTIRELGYSDAFVVAYRDGERIALNDALNEEDAAGIIARATEKGDGGVNNTTIENQETIENTSGSSLPEFDAASANTDYYNAPGAAPAVQVERVRGLFFTVQVGVYSKPVSATALFNISPLNSEQTANGNIRYTSGMFPDLDLARSQRQIVVNAGVSDAFITAYYNGQRITVSRARELLQSEGDAVLATGGGAPAATPVTPPVEKEEPEGTVQDKEASTTEELPEGDTAMEFADAADFDPEDIRFVVDLGSFGEGMPQQTADAILQLSEAGVTRLALPDGKMHYLSRPTANFSEAEDLRQAFIDAGVEEVDLRAMALGFLLRVEDARQATGQ